MKRVSPFVKPNMSGQYLKTIRTNRGESLEEAAAAMGVSARTVRRWEHEGVSRHASAIRVFKTCEYYDISADYLIELMKQPATKE